MLTAHKLDLNIPAAEDQTSCDACKLPGRRVLDAFPTAMGTRRFGRIFDRGILCAEQELLSAIPRWRGMHGP